MSTVAATARRSVEVSAWLGAPIVLAVLLLGFLLGRASIGNTPADHPSPVRVGVVGTVDNDGTICIEKGDCYLVPGATLKVGTKIHYRVVKQPIDPDDPAAGKQSVLVYVAAD